MDRILVTPEEAAKWMAAEVRSEEYLDHAAVIDHLEAADPALIDYNDAGNPVVDKKVLAAFKKLQLDDIVWSRSGQHWRLREPDDEAGRMVP